MRLIATGLYIALFIWMFGILLYQFAMLARRGQWDKVMLKDGALLSLAKFPVFVVILILTASP